MLSFSISYRVLIKFHYFTEITNRGVRGWKEAQRWGIYWFSIDYLFLFGGTKWTVPSCLLSNWLPPMLGGSRILTWFSTWLGIKKMYKNEAQASFIFIVIFFGSSSALVMLFLCLLVIRIVFLHDYCCSCYLLALLLFSHYCLVLLCCLCYLFVLSLLFATCVAHVAHVAFSRFCCCSFWVVVVLLCCFFCIFFFRIATPFALSLFVCIAPLALLPFLRCYSFRIVFFTLLFVWCCPSFA